MTISFLSFCHSSSFELIICVVRRLGLILDQFLQVKWRPQFRERKREGRNSNKKNANNLRGELK